MFFVDNYAPKNIDDIHFHKSEIEKLREMSKDDSIPHIIFYGPEGSGKKTIISHFLEMLYDKHVHELVDSVYNVHGSGNTTTQVTIKQSNYHIVIEPNNNNFDRYLIQDVVKEYARRIPLRVFTAKKMFKTVLINNIDNLSFYAQTSLRRTLENYAGTCRFIMWSRSLSKVIEPLRSRCYVFKIDSPSFPDMYTFLLNICGKEQIKLHPDEMLKIIDRAKGNIKEAIWLLQLHNLGDTYDTTYDETINKVAELILTREEKAIIEIRDLVYRIMITNKTGTTTIKNILMKLLESDEVSDIAKINITEIAAHYEHNLIRGRREIIHLDAFIINTMEKLYQLDKTTKITDKQKIDL